MTTFTVADGDDWMQPIEFGSFNDRWRLDDYDIEMHVKPPGGASVLIEATTANGKLALTDPANRRLEVNVGWSEIEAAGPGPFEFDFLFVNKTTAIHSHSAKHSLSITRTITKDQA